MKNHGLISNYDDYVDLPYTVIEDARLLMEAEGIERERQRQRNGR